MVFSIIVPVYNVEKYIKKCLDSIVNQDFHDYEVIVVDDGSTDGGSIICDNYAINYPCIKVIHQQNGGLSRARNVGIENAAGDYIMFVDSDDWIAEGTLKKFGEIVLQNDIDLVVGKAKSIDDYGNTRDKVYYTIPQGKYTIDEYLAQLRDTESYTACAPFTLYKRDFIKANGLSFKEGLIHEDEIWTPTVLLCADTIYCSDVYFYFHYIRMGSINRSNNYNESGKNLFAVVKELQSILSKHDDSYAQVIRDQMVVLYLQAICLVDDYTPNIINANYLRKNSFYAKTKIKSWIYSVSPKIYVLIRNLKGDRRSCQYIL